MPGTDYEKTGCMISDQTFCDLQTLLHTFFGFPGAYGKVNVLIDLMEGWTFVGLQEYITSNFQRYKIQGIFFIFICVTYRHFFYHMIWGQQKNQNNCKNTYNMIFSLQMKIFVHKNTMIRQNQKYVQTDLGRNMGNLNKFWKCL